MYCFPGVRFSHKLFILVLLLSSGIWAQKVAGPPTLQQVQAQAEQGNQGEPVEDDPWGRRIWMRERFSGEPWDYKDMMFRETQRQRQRYPQLEAGAPRGASSPTPTWVSIGPTNASFETNSVTLNVVDSGRARTILPDPADQNTVYLLTSGGGLWKTTNFLQTNPTWAPKTDNLPTTGGGSVAFGRTPNVLYLGLGDPFDDFPLAGGFVTKSTDGGDSWGTVNNLATATSIRDIKVDTSGATDIVMVATDGGFYRSTDGGNTYDSSPNPSIGGRVLWSLAKTSAGWLVSAADGTLWLSTDQGATWNQTGTGFSGAGRSTLGVGAVGDSIVYDFAANPGGTDQLDLFRSVDGGQSWAGLGLPGKTPSNPNSDQSDMDIMHAQAFYNQMILVDPTDGSRNTVYIGGNLCTAKTTDGGATWTLITDWLPRSGANLPYAHADFHAAAISMLTSPAKLFFGSDGGLFVSNDSGGSWDYRKNVGIVSHLVYALTSNPTSPNSTIVGLQDNGTRVRESNTTVYDQTRGGDGFGVGTSQANANWTLSTYVHDAIDNSTDLGANWTPATTGINTSTSETPFSTAITSPAASADPTGAVFFTTGLHAIYETTNGAGMWNTIGSSGSGGISAGQMVRALVHVVGVSPVDTNHIAVAGTGGVLLLTTDGGTSWSQIPLNSAVPGYNSSSSNIAWVNNSVLYVCSEAPNLGAVRVVKSTDGGTTWAAANNGLPDVSVSKLQVDPNDSTGNTLYAGTFIGVYQTTDGGASWHEFGAGLPNVHVTDIYMPPDGSFIRISTYGRGIWETTPSGILPATHFQVTAPASASAAIPFNVTVTALDSTNSVVPSYTGTVHFTSTDGTATLPANYTFVSGDNGVHTFSVTLRTLGNQTVTATDTSSVTGTSPAIMVIPGPATHYVITGAPASIAAGSAFNLTVTAQDSLNNTATGYRGTAHFTSSDAQAGLPVDYTFTAADSGVHTFSFILGTQGSQTVTATDFANSFNKTSPSITVNPGATAHFKVQPSATSITASSSSNLNVTVTAQDAYNNTTPAYGGTVHFTSGDSQAVLPANSTLTSGVGTFPVTLKTAGQRTIVATDTVTSSITGISSLITVSPAAASKYSMSTPATATAGVFFTVRLVAQDPFNNTATGYTGTVHFTTSDAGGGVVLPGDYTFLAGDSGQKTFTNAFKLQTAGAQSITGTDTVTGSIHATNPITVTTDPFITPQAKNIHIFRANIPVIVAGFTDADAGENGSDYTATINWGDGSAPDSGCTTGTTNCKIVRVGSSNVFNVIGSHVYKKKGSFTVHVTLNDSGGSQADAFSTASFSPINSSH